MRRTHARTLHATCAVSVRLLRIRTRHALQTVGTHMRVPDQHTRVTVIRAATSRRRQTTERIVRMRSRWAALACRAVHTVQTVGAHSARRPIVIHLAACLACAACAAVRAEAVRPKLRASCACARTVPDGRLAAGGARQALLAIRTVRADTCLALGLQSIRLLASVAPNAHAAILAVPTSWASLTVVSLGIRLLPWRARLARRHGEIATFVVTMRAVQALDAVRRANTELNDVGLFARRTEAARHTIRAVSTRWTDIALRVGRICRTTRHTSHTLVTRGTRPAMAHLIELVRIVAHQALRQI